MNHFSQSEQPASASSSSTVPGSSMRKLIRCKRTKRFLAKDAVWTDDICHAMHIPEHAEAKNLVQQFNLQDVEVYYSFGKFGQSQWDFAISLA